MWQLLLLLTLGTCVQYITGEHVMPLKSSTKAELQDEIISFSTRTEAASTVKQVAVDPPTRGARNAIVDKSRLWPNGRIPFVFDFNVPAFSKVEILAAMQEIESSVYSTENTCIIFIPRQSETDYVHISLTTGNHGSTNIGRHGGRQELTINTSGGRGHDDNLYILMLVLGLYPEAMRNDRDQYLNIDLSNTQSSQSFQKLSGQTTDFFGLPFDYTSMLLYSPYQLATDQSKPVTIASDPSVVMGQSVSLSVGDVSLLQHTYNCPLDTSNRVNILTNTQINCHFTSGFCSLHQDQQDEFDWVLAHGPRSTPGTGPNADYSSGAGKFAVAKAAGYHNRVGRLTTSTFTAGEYCLRVSMYMYGSDMGRLDIKALHSGGEVSLFAKAGALGNAWYHSYVEIQSKADFSISFQATIGNGDLSDIALDDIYIYNGLCIEWN